MQSREGGRWETKHFKGMALPYKLILTINLFTDLLRIQQANQ